MNRPASASSPPPRRRTAGVPALTATLVAAGAGCDGGDQARAPAPPPVVVESIESPAPPGSAEPNLAVGPDGFYLSWLEATDSGRHALRFSRLGPEGWTPPRTILERGDLFVNWADFPSLLVLEDGTLAAHWLEKSGPGTYAYDVRAALSKDGGRTWSEDIVPHQDGLEVEHGFVTLLPLEGGRSVGVVWLDGRETARGGAMTLRFARIGGDGGVADGALLDADVCDCCQTGAAVGADGPIVVYRDRTEGEVRDIRVVRRVGGAWTEPVPVHEDGWVINACPVNGPSVAARERRVAVAWFTGAPGPRVLAAFSDDAGATFGPPVRVDDGAGQGRVAVVLLDDGAALVSWLEGGGSGAEIRLRRVEPEGTGPALRLAGTSAERASGFPRMARDGDRLLFAWTEAGSVPRVRTAVGRLPGAAAGGEP